MPAFRCLLGFLIGPAHLYRQGRNSWRDRPQVAGYPAIAWVDFQTFFLTGGLRPTDPPEKSASGLPDQLICIANPISIREAGGRLFRGVWGAEPPSKKKVWTSLGASKQCLVEAGFLFVNIEFQRFWLISLEMYVFTRNEAQDQHSLLDTIFDHIFSFGAPRKY